MAASESPHQDSLANPETKHSLVIGLEVGNNDQWARFHRVYAPLIRRVGRRYGVAASELEALVNKVMMALDKAMRVNGSFKYNPEKGRFYNYVYTIAKHEAFASNKHLAQELAQEPAAESEDVISQMEVEQCLYDTLQTLHDEAQGVVKRDIEIFRRAVLDEEPTEALAAEYGIDTGRVYGIKSEVRSVLRARFRRDWGDLA